MDRKYLNMWDLVDGRAPNQKMKKEFGIKSSYKFIEN